MKKQNTDFQIQGKKVNKTYVSDPYISNGSFLIVNNKVDSVNVSIKSVWLSLGGKRQIITGVSIFDMNKEETLNSGNFHVESNSKKLISVGFTRIPIQEPINKNIFIEVSFDIQGVEMKVISNIQLTRRIPLINKP